MLVEVFVGGGVGVEVAEGCKVAVDVGGDGVFVYVGTICIAVAVSVTGARVAVD